MSHVYEIGSNEPMFAVDVTETLGAGVQSLRARRLLAGLGRQFEPEQFLRAMTTGPRAAIGVQHAVACGRVQLAGV